MNSFRNSPDRDLHTLKGTVSRDWRKLLTVKTDKTHSHFHTEKFKKNDKIRYFLNQWPSQDQWLAGERKVYW